MKTTRFSNPFVMATALAVATIVPAVIQGQFSNRWGAPPDLIAAAQRLNEIPDHFGNWIKVADGKVLTDTEALILHAFAHSSGTYRNQLTGERVEVIMTVGPAGPIVRHNPEFCYETRNAIHIGDSTALKITTADQVDHSFRDVRFQAPNALSSEFEIAYGWSNGGPWSRPNFPRIDFGGDTLIYSLQLFSEEMTPEETRAAFTAFLKEFLPAIQSVVLAPSGAQ